MGTFDDISALLDDVLNEDETKELSPDEAEQVAEALAEEAEETEPLSSITPPESETPVVDEIEALIAEATGEATLDVEDEPEPEDVPTVGTEEDDERVVTADAYIAVHTPQTTEGLFAQGAGDEAIELPSFTSDEIMEQIDIRNFGTLVKLKTMRWHARIKDKAAAREMAKAAQAEDGTYEGYKHLLAGCDEKLKRIHKAIDAARTAHYALTLPWSVVSLNDQGKRAGPRLLPNTLFMEYTTAMGNAKLEMDDALNDFETAYPNLVALAQSKMGTAFNPADYPHMDVVRQHFGLHFDFEPIPKGSDFDGIQAQMAQKLAATLDNKTRTSLENAMQEAWHRLYTTVGHAASVLSNPDKTFHYTLVDKLRDQAGMLKHLNATKDQRIEDCRLQVEQKLTKHDPKDIRKDDALRRKLAQDAQVIYDDMKGHIQ
jgi:hypothetical protein